MSGHTPGPWKLKVHTGKDDEIGPGDDWTVEGGGVAICFEGLYNPNAKADARLISAAPDLLIELRQAVIQLEMAAECIQNKRYDEALLHASSLMRSKRAAIEKATGGSE